MSVYIAMYYFIIIIIIIIITIIIIIIIIIIKNLFLKAELRRANPYLCDLKAPLK